MVEKVESVHLLNKSDEWETPKYIFDILNEEFNFDLDPAATHENHVCEKYFTKEFDGLGRSWRNHTVFLNPPYSRQIGRWIEKAYNESRDPYTTVVCLIPSSTDTKWWHKYCMKANEIRFIKGRIKFKNKFYPVINSARFSSSVVIFKNEGELFCKAMEI